MLAVAVLFLAGVEGVTRVVLRVWNEGWPETLAASIDDARRATSVLYRVIPSC